MVDVQKAVYAALAGDATLATLIDDIYDHVPQDAAFPYLEVGNAAFNDAGTKTENIVEFQYEVHTWTRATGHYEVRQIQDQVRVVLHHAALTPDSGTIVHIHEDFRESIADPDGISLHGVQRFTILYQYA